MSFTTRALLGAALAAAGLSLGGPNTALAGWYNCGSGTHVAYNPITGRSIQIGVATDIGASLDRPVWAWVCIDDGGILGAQSVGHASYVGVPGYTAHTLVCPSTQEPCVGTWTGGWVYSPSSGQVGARPCVSPVIAESAICVSAGASLGSVPSASIEGPSSGDFCVVNVAGVCALQRVTVRTGGNVATVYIGDTPIAVDVPALCVGTSRPGNAVTIQPGSTC